ncbi:MAG: PTS lactose/cellobiose transporter subunit IIA [Erysipelotrichaceae bacterium]|nr:PTS lactose/cellobiose transporter subunit IIA [Erysipelotrichaceae bacterium]MDY5252774.1 PTS lactose/cellobiose transporter subunit IIA [Erysipelotrichaceae bacterium]
MEGLELISFQIISSVGMARSSFIEAIKEAKLGNIEEAKNKIKEGEDYFTKGHGFHAELIQKEASGDSVQLNLLLMHAEDQLMSAESIKIVALEFIDTFERLNALEKKL